MALIVPMALLLMFLMCLRNVRVLSRVTSKYMISDAQSSCLTERVSLGCGMCFGGGRT